MRGVRQQHLVTHSICRRQVLPHTEDTKQNGGPCSSPEDPHDEQLPQPARSSPVVCANKEQEPQPKLYFSSLGAPLVVAVLHDVVADDGHAREQQRSHVAFAFALAGAGVGKGGEGRKDGDPAAPVRAVSATR